MFYCICYYDIDDNDIVDINNDSNNNNEIVPPTGADAKAFFDEVLPMFSSIVRDGDLDRFAKQSDSRLPCFSYVGPILHRGRTTCLLGTYVHMCVFIIPCILWPCFFWLFV